MPLRWPHWAVPRTRTRGELRALWSETGLLDEFRAVVAGIRSALQSTVA